MQELQELLRERQRQHEREVQRMETKFLEDKARMQKQMEQELAAMTADARQAALSRLDQAARITYEENIRLAESVRLHTAEASQLRQVGIGG